MVKKTASARTLFIIFVISYRKITESLTKKPPIRSKNGRRGYRP